MLERNQGSGDYNYLAKAIEQAGLSAVVGALVGGLTYGGVGLFTDGSHAERWGLGVGGFLAGVGFGAMMSNLSLERAEMFHRSGRKREFGQMLLQATIEGAFGVGMGAGMAGYEINGVSGAMIGLGIGLLFGGYSTRLNFRTRIERFPQLETPAGNSTVRDTSFPDRSEGRILPLVYRASSLSDFVEFRAANKEILVQKAGRVSSLSDRPDSGNRNAKYLTATAIIPDVSHNPSESIHEQGKDMQLTDGLVYIAAHPCEGSSLFWPNKTIFEEVVGPSRIFSERKWNKYRNSSWQNMILLLCQYQIPGMNSERANPPLDRVVDNYWLLDINVARPRGGRRVIKPVRSWVPLPWAQPEPASQGI